MKRIVCLALVALAVSVPAHFLPAGDVVNGNWRLTTLATAGNSESTNVLFKVETSEGKTTATILSAVATKGAAEPELVSFNVSRDKVRVVLKTPAEEVFEGRLVNDGKKIVGIFVGGKSALAAYMMPTEMTKLDAKNSVEMTKIGAKVATTKLAYNSDDLKTWAEVSCAAAKEFGPTTIAEINTQFATVFLAKRNTSLAVEYALAAEKALNSDMPMELQVRALQTVTKALDEARKKTENTLKPLSERFEKMLDEEYMAVVPPFKGEGFRGRKGHSDRVVVMELFTGAQCPPCVAADVAFDVLGKTYNPSDLVLIQYHLHIPGPDPMTNADTEARAKYYKASSTPSTFFNGAKKASGGGAMAAAEKKYRAYRQVIDPLLEEPAACKLSASATRVKDKIQIHAVVVGLEKPGKNVKLHTILLEDHIRFTGSNKLRFHHDVVRAMPGGPNGVTVNGPLFTTMNEVSLSELRAKQVNYLDNYVLTKKAFPQPERPLDFHGLRVVALVQDDDTQEILQAVQVDVKE